MKAASSELLDLESSLEDVVSDLVDNISKDKRTSRSKGKASFGTKQMQSTYLELCRNHLNPITRYIKAMHLGVLTKDMIEVMQLIVAPLLKKTRQVGMDQHARKLQSFSVVLQEVARKTASGRVQPEQVASLEEVYWPMHEAFKLQMRGNAVAVANLLSFYRKLKNSTKVAPQELRKLFAIGVPSLSMIRKSSLDELTSLSGIPLQRISEIRKIAREFQLIWCME